MRANPWLLPDGIDEALPARAEALENLRRRCIALFHAWGYELVSPPLVEYLDSLLTGVGNDLDLQTFKLTDQISGRTMGVRADMTPQVARIEAHRLRREVPVRLCYLGVVLHTRPRGFGRRRNPLQLGAELYGHAGPEADHEVLTLMLRTLALAGIERPHLDLGHVGLFRALARECGLPGDTEDALFEALQRKDVAELDERLAAPGLDRRCRDRFRPLIDLNGDHAVLTEARRIYADAPAEVSVALDQLQRLYELAAISLPDTPLHFDLAELRGYGYHTGLVFAAYLPGHGQAIAQGGRYDGTGEVFGRGRPATGFSTDLKTLVEVGELERDPPRMIYAPWGADPRQIAALRVDGERVVSGLPAQTGGAIAMGCSRELIERDGQWQLVDVESDA